MKNLLCRLAEPKDIWILRVSLLAALGASLFVQSPYLAGLQRHEKSSWWIALPAVAVALLFLRVGEKWLPPLLFLCLYTLLNYFPPGYSYELRLHPMFFGLLLLWARTVYPHNPVIFGRPWAPLLAQLYLSLVYFDGGLGKILGNLSKWLSGESLRSYLAVRWAITESPFTLAVYRLPGASMAFSITVLIFELTFPIAVLFFHRTLLPLYLAFGLVFQFTAYWILGISFVFPYLICFYLQAWNWESLRISPSRVLKTALALLAFFPQIAAGDVSQNYQCIQEDALLGFAPKPSCEGIGLVDGTLKSRSNAQGLRDRDFSPMPASSVTRILLIGPSNIYGESDSVNPAKFLERYLNSKASPRRFEVINGGMLGFSTLQSALQMPGLLNAYHPHAVIYDVNLSATLISTWYMHGAVEKGPAGTVTTLKDFNLYWPLPAAAHSWLGRFHTRWITASRFLRVYTRLLSLSASRAFRNGPNPLFNDYKLYLSSMAESCRKQNVKFFVSTVEGTQNFFRQAKIPFWGKPEWVAYHFLPAELVSLPEIETFWKDLPAAFPVLDAREAFRQNAPPQYLGEVSHFDRRGLEIHGEALGRSLLESGF